MDRELRWAVRGALLCLGAGLLAATLSLPREGKGLRGAVFERLPESGGGTPVTAVLLDFRGYDTLLEVAVLFAAAVGAWSLVRATVPRGVAPGPVLVAAVRVLAPLMILVAGYLLWAGSAAAGGAFQSGSVLAAAVVLLLLAEPGLAARARARLLRPLLACGLLFFAGTAAGTLLFRGTLLAYPPAAARTLILAIEVVAAVSVAATLASLFSGGRPEEEA